MTAAVGHRDEHAYWRQHAAQLTDGRVAVGYVIEHVDRQHDVKRAVPEGQRGDIGVKQVHHRALIRAWCGVLPAGMPPAGA